GSPAQVCPWGCYGLGLDGDLGTVSGCCDAVLDELRRMREGAQREMLTVAEAVLGASDLTKAERDRIFTADGKLKSNARRFLQALPAKCLEDVAARSGLPVNAAKKVSVPLRRAGLVQKTRQDGWVRAKRAAGT